MGESAGEGAWLSKGAGEGVDEGITVDATDGSGVGDWSVAVPVQTSGTKLVQE